jgi:hypothetical protein
MPTLVENIPAIQCLVRREFLHDLQSGHGEYDECFWVSAKSIPSRALYIESYINEYGALYDKLPLSAYCWKKVDDPLPLSELQMWDCLSYSIVCIQKTFLRDRDCRVMLPISKRFMDAKYLFTLDTYGEGTLAETPNEHKSYNFVRLANGQFGAYPNNRILWKDASFTPEKPKTPTFKTSTIQYHAEGNFSMADDDKYFYGMEEHE